MFRYMCVAASDTPSQQPDEYTPDYTLYFFTY